MRKPGIFQGKEKQLQQQGIKKTRVRKRKEYLDYDYIDTLSESNKQYLKKFSREFYGGNFDNNSLHSKEQKNELWDNNNKLNSDIYGIAKSLNKLDNINEEFGDFYIQENDNEFVDRLLDCSRISKNLGITEMEMLFIVNSKRHLEDFFNKYKIPKEDMIDYFIKKNGNRFKLKYKVSNMDHFYMRKHIMNIKRILTKNKISAEILLKNL